MSYQTELKNAVEKFNNNFSENFNLEMNPILKVTKFIEILVTEELEEPNDIQYIIDEVGGEGNFVKYIIENTSEDDITNLMEDDERANKLFYDIFSSSMILFNCIYETAYKQWDDIKEKNGIEHIQKD